MTGITIICGGNMLIASATCGIAIMTTDAGTYDLVMINGRGSYR
jgi:hypothetical protein